MVDVKIAFIAFAALLVANVNFKGCEACFGSTGTPSTQAPPSLVVTLPTAAPTPAGQTPAPFQVPATTTNNPIPAGSCGLNSFSGNTIRTLSMQRVLGGSPASPGEIPWQARLIINSNGANFLCGGAIVSNQWVITAAHCITEGSDVTVSVGGTTLSNDDNQAVSTKAYSIFKHPYFNPTTGDYDIALVQLTSSLQFSASIQPICVPTSCDYDCAAGSQAVISGWGTTSADSTSPVNILQKASVNVVSTQTCQNGYDTNRISHQVTGRMICAGNPSGTTDTCRGDDGGPLSCKPSNDAAGRYFLTGIKSYVVQCGKPGLYSTYTEPCQVFRWISQVTNYATLPSAPAPTPATTPAPTPAPILVPSPPPIFVPSPPPPQPSPVTASPTTQATPPPAPSPVVSPSQINSPGCGTSQYADAGSPGNTRIVGGAPARPNEFPWQVRIMTQVPSGGTYICGGSIITNQWVITAAHCIVSSDTQGGTSTIHLGGQRSDSDSDDELILNVIKEVPHPSYDDTTHDYDVALLQLSRTITFSDTMRPICMLPAGCSGETAAGTNCSISGWGTLTEGGDAASAVLQKAQVPIATRPQCQQAYDNQGGAVSITSNMICAGNAAKGGVDTCQGDSGGPLGCRLNGGSQFYLNGVTSFGQGCARPGLYGVYARPCNLMNWIQSTIGSSRGRRQPNTGKK